MLIARYLIWIMVWITVHPKVDITLTILQLTMINADWLF